MLRSADRHVLSRFSYGLTPDLIQEVKSRGGAASWLAAQGQPSKIKDPAADKLDTWWPEFRHSPEQLWKDSVSGKFPGWEVMSNFQRWSMLRRIMSKRQLLETMTEFWQNHLHVPVTADGVFTHRISYDRMIRQHALGSYADLLYHSITHPAMGIYLGNAESTKHDTNENLGRELLELHTVGRGNFDEDDVKNSAWILTGWHVDMWETWAPTYDKSSHFTGRVQVMGFSSGNKDSDGQALTRKYLNYLAHHPATARRIATKLAVKFVSDAPSAGLINKLAKVYLKHDTAILPVLHALIGHREFHKSRGLKVRTPEEDVVAMYRALGIKLWRPVSDESAVNNMLWQVGSMGAYPYDWPRPDGPPIDSSSWASTSRMLASWQVHTGTSAGWWPKEGLSWPEATYWMPEKKMRFRDLVDGIAQRMIGRTAPPTLLQACCEVVRYRPHQWVRADDPLITDQLFLLLTTVLDSPYHMTR